VDLIKRRNRTPTARFNSMINRLIPYTIKGALWYQGNQSENSREVQKTFSCHGKKDWRHPMGIGIPFLLVQIAALPYDGDNDVFQTFEKFSLYA